MPVSTLHRYGYFYTTAYWTTPIGRLLTMAVFTAVLRNMPELSATGLNDLRHLRRINW
jgi:hypothetical protein